MGATELLARLHGVKATGQGRWIARCPAHDDSRASLAIRELDDGRLLIHDFAGCSALAVVRAVGLGLEALFPPRLDSTTSPGTRRAFYASDVLAAIAFEALIVSVAAENTAAGKVLSHDDRARLMVAASRLQEAAHIANG